MQYYINFVSQEVHTETCNWKPSSTEIVLGIFDCPCQAIVAAKKIGYHYAEACCYCCKNTTNNADEEGE